MPDRIIRDELLTSERYWGVSPEARNLFVGIILTADDAARCVGTAFALRTRCMGATVSADKVEELLTELSTADLVRPYDSGGVRYLYVPRFGQRRRYVKSSKMPEPPKRIIELTENKSDLRRTQDKPETVSSQSQDGPETRGVGVGVGVGEGLGLGLERGRSGEGLGGTLESTLPESTESASGQKPPSKIPSPQTNDDEPTVDQIERREAEKRRQKALLAGASERLEGKAPIDPVEAAKAAGNAAIDATTAPRQRDKPPAQPKPQPPATPAAPLAPGAARLAMLQAGPTNGRTKAPKDWAMSEEGIILKAAELHIERGKDETMKQLRQRCMQAAK